MFKKFFSIAFTTALVLYPSGYLPAKASEMASSVTIEPSKYSTIDGYETVLPYLFVTPQHTIRFNKDKALADSASYELIQVGEFVNSISKGGDVHPQDRAKVVIWGNWCGPEHSGPAAPVDQLDTACMHHDICYSDNGYFNCFCDRVLIDEINERFPNMAAQERVAARAIQAYFTAQKLWCRQ